MKLHHKCPTYWKHNGSKICSKTTYVEMSFYEARELCGYHHSDLIRLDSVSTQNFMEQFLLSEAITQSIDMAHKSYWVGLHKVDYAFYWLQYASLLWNTDKLDTKTMDHKHECVAMKYDSINETWIWFTVDCIEHLAYPICQKSIGTVSII